MHPFFKITSLVFLLVFAVGFIGCEQAGNAKDKITRAASLEVLKKVPELLDRPVALRYDEEWVRVQNAYGKARQELINNLSAVEPWLDLSAIFIQEARVTGEHPHYYTAALQVLDELLSKNFAEGDVHQQDLKFRALSAKAGVELSLHEFAKALRTGREAVALNPYNAAVYGVLVDANVEMGNYEEAVNMADRMVSIRPDLRSYSRVSYLREIHGDLDGAIEAMQMAVRAGYPGTDQTSWARMTLGQLYEAAGQAEVAKIQYEVILEERPGYPFAIAALGDLALEKKNYEEAERLLEQAAAIIPEVGFYESLAGLYQETGRAAEFNQTFEEIIAMMKDDEAHGHNMSLEFAHVYSGLKNDHQQALAYALTEYEKRPGNIDVNGLLAMLYQKLGNPQKAAEHLEKALRTGSQRADWIAMRE